MSRCANLKPTRTNHRRPVFDDIVHPWYVLSVLLILAGLAMAWMFLTGAEAIALNLSEDRLIPVLALFAWAGAWGLAGECWKQGGKR